MIPIRCLTNCMNLVRPTIRKCRFQFRELSDNPRPHPKIDEPIRFRESRAATWKAQFTRQGYEDYDDTPWYQGIVVSLSVGVFLLYFCVLREESDIDEELGKTLYDRIEGLEEVQLQASLKYNFERGLDTRAIEARLHEIELEQKNQN